MTSKVTIICRRPGMYRNGVSHEAKAVYDADHWTPEQLQNFRNDPAFEVIEGEDLSEDVNTLASENSTLKSQVADLTSKFAAMTAERDQLFSQAEQAKTLIAKLETEITDAKAAAETVKAELEQLKAAAAKPADEKAGGKK
ncbi:hypothetical protein [Rhizobium sp. C1]|uniref:hypothetical protein n=1 Tax=Rhizobium sp. C1 TaxID=1349799 RepID=UPI001E41E42B|nr:hypothetical protein [Rhizobium sp. C1]MCD2176448.1 hypothetical protein [Rhizobium sp. C1]